MLTPLDACRALLAVLALYALAAAPLLPGNAWTGWALEPVAILAMLLLVPRRIERALRALVTGACALLLILAAADWGTGLAFGRAFDLARDRQLPRFGWNVFSNAIGSGLAAAALILAVVGIALALALLFHVLGAWSRSRGNRRIALCGIATALTGAGLVAAPAVDQPATPAYDRVALHVEQLTTRRADEARFRAGLAQSPAHADSDLSVLAGKDVLFVFVESYGRTVFDRPLYAETIGPRLADFQARIENAGFAARSGWLTSPTVGGQSWLAHGTLLSGLWVDGQPRYDALIASDRVSLNRRFRDAGWRTAAVMPAITRAWPDAAWFGYDRIHASGDLGYAGEPFNWVTMPDQYTLAALERAELDIARERPVMIEAALISSHAPWVPIPPLLDWSKIGDGRVFNEYARAGDPPVVVWKDADRVRAQYRKAIDYSLQTLASFIAERADEDLVLVILGDHQPAPIITGDDSSRDVPMHIISADPAVLAAVDNWQWARGMTPDANTPVWRMDAFYERFLKAFDSRSSTR